MFENYSHQKKKFAKRWVYHNTHIRNRISIKEMNDTKHFLKIKVFAKNEDHSFI